MPSSLKDADNVVKGEKTNGKLMEIEMLLSLLTDWFLKTYFCFNSVYMWICVCVSTDAMGPRRKLSDALELELQLV